MTEDYLQFIWRHKKLPINHLKTTCGEAIEILDFGFLNKDAGPDFFNGRVRIANQIWVGNIEIHIKSSDWYVHKHQFNRAYDNVVLHVVYEYDRSTFNSKGSEIPTLEIKHFIEKAHYNNFKKIVSNKTWIPCQNQLKSIDEFYTRTFLERLTIERIQRKSDEILNLLESEKYNWEEIFYQKLLSVFGSKVNQEAFFQIAKQTPLSIVRKIGSNQFQLESLYLGQSGLLGLENSDDYFHQIKKEYQFLKKKFSLTPIDVENIKFSKLRPSNFPTIRLVQFSRLMAKNSSWFSFMSESDLDGINKSLNIELRDYWEKHYVFDEISIKRTKRIGSALKDSIAINVVVPFLIIYSTFQADELMREKSMNLLISLNPEKNNIIQKWAEIGVKAESAFHSQALLELKNEYCSAKKCLNCSIGVKLLNRYGKKHF